MGLKYFLFSGLIGCGLVILSVHGFAADNLAPRAEVSVKGGSERSTLTTEFWAPLAQKSDRVVYTDLRLMGDDDDNREGNLGIGYRQIYAPTNSVLGIHGWIDRRRTEHNSTFHQATFGVESLGDKIDLRANGYVPLNGSHTVTTPNLGSTTPYLAGNGLFFDTNGSVSETPQYGVDAEAGYRLPIFEKQIDTLRVYGGGYHFFRSNTENVTGFRIRTEAQVNQIVSVGARFQHDGPRGSQGFLEATLRFPFSAKKLYQKSGLTSRLDESPERDIDIVTASKVDNGLHKEITNTTTGQSQRILYVDNTQTNGDGTKEHPFNNLQSAQAALQANDILYVFHGDGTTHNMDQGITISQPGVQLIGSGSPLTISGYTFLNAGAAPILTNTQTSINNFIGNGVTVTGDNTIVSGININHATNNGIYVVSDNAVISNVSITNSLSAGLFASADGTGSTINIITVNNSSITNNVGRGLWVYANNGGTINTAIIENNTTNNNFRGIEIRADASGSILKNAYISGNTSIGNTDAGLNITSSTNGVLGSALVQNNTILNSGGRGLVSVATISDLIIRNNISSSNGINGIYVFSNSVKNAQVENNVTNNNTGTGITISMNNLSQTDSIKAINNIANNNRNYGIQVSATSGAHVEDILITGNTTNNNLSATGNGIFLQSTGSGSLINNATISSNTANGNFAQGIYAQAITSGQLTNLTVTNNTMSANQNAGLYVQANNTGNIGNANVTNNIATNNTGASGYGIMVASGSTTASIISSTLSGNTMTGNAQAGLFISNNTSSSLSTSLLNNNITGNATNGVYISQSGTGSFVVDMGGGTLSSTGGNRVFGDTGTEVRVDGGYALSAKINYWGGTDLLTGEKTLNSGSTVNSTGFLTTDPRP